MEEQLNRLNANPDDWNLRISIVRSLYDSGQTARASQILCEAPGIPQDEPSILFSTTVIGAADPARGLAFLEGFTDIHGVSPETESLRTRLSQGKQPRQPVPSQSVNSPRTPIQPRQEDHPGSNDPAPPRTPVPSESTRSFAPVPPREESATPPDEKPPSKKGLLPRAPVPPEESEEAVSEPEIQTAEETPPARSEESEEAVSEPEIQTAEETPPVPPEESEGAVSKPEIQPNQTEEKAHPKKKKGLLPKSPTSSKSKIAPDRESEESSPSPEDEATAKLEGNEEDASDPDKVLLVAKGEAVHAAELEDDSREKLKSVIIAVVIHLVLFISFFFWAVSAPPALPPQITASIPPAEQAELDARTRDRKKAKNTTPVAVTLPSVAAATFSDFALPDTLNLDLNVDLTAMSDSDSAFSMSMNGFGGMSGMSGVPAGMRSRCSPAQRMKRLRESGGDERAEIAVQKGLEFLVTQQDQKTGAFGEEFTAGMTGLALLAYLGHCETPESAKFGDSVVKAALYLMQVCQENGGKITNSEEGHHEAYEHAIATYALCELFTMTKASGREVPRLGSILTKAVGLIVSAQSPTGGWPYGFNRDGPDDLSVSSWQIQALKAAYNTGQRYGGVERALTSAIQKYIPSIQDSQGALKYNPEDPAGRDSLTGAGVLALQIWGGNKSSTYYDAMRFLKTRYLNPTPGGNYYTPYYNTQAFFMAEGEEWEAYNSKFQPLLLNAQNSNGSWLGSGPRKDDRIMNTAWAILMLEVYYRYLPTTDKVSGLKIK